MQRSLVIFVVVCLVSAVVAFTEQNLSDTSSFLGSLEAELMNEDDFAFVEMDADMAEADTMYGALDQDDDSSPDTEKRRSRWSFGGFFRSIGKSIRKTTSTIRRSFSRAVSRRTPTYTRSSRSASRVRSSTRNVVTRRAAVRARTPVRAPTRVVSSGRGGTGCLPSLSTAKKCFIQGNLASVKKQLGGGADASYITNSCAMKMSQLMNCNAETTGKSQCAIKKQSGLVTVPDKSGQRLALRVKELLPVLKQRLGTPTMDVRASSRGVDFAQFKGKAGIVVFDTTGAWKDATGHMSVLTGDGRLIEKHISTSDVQKYFKLSVRVTFWQM